jgi:hypothetical protein
MLKGLEFEAVLHLHLETLQRKIHSRQEQLAEWKGEAQMGIQKDAWDMADTKDMKAYSLQVHWKHLV